MLKGIIFIVGDECLCGGRIVFLMTDECLCGGRIIFLLSDECLCLKGNCLSAMH